MTTGPRIWSATIAPLAATLVLAASGAAAAQPYEPFFTDFPKGNPASTPVDPVAANDTAHFGERSKVPAAAAPTDPASSGLGWTEGGAALLGAALLGLVALGLGRRSRRTAIAFVFVAGAASLAVTGIVAAGGAKDDRDVATPRDLVANGWFCVDVPDNWVHCVPPGVDLAKDPPESMLNLNFYTHDPSSDDAKFLGEETLIRADVWKALPRQWPCGKKAYGVVPAEALPPYGYMYCHHFKEPKPLGREALEVPPKP